MEVEQYEDALRWARRGMDLPTTWQSRSLFDLAAAIHPRGRWHEVRPGALAELAKRSPARISRPC